MTQNNDRPRTYKFDHLNIRNIGHLAQRINFPEELLYQISSNPAQYYKPEIKEPKKSGGFRVINPPFEVLKKIQKKINRLLQEVKIPPSFYGGVLDKSNILNAAQHLNKKHVACFDIKDFFPSISSGRTKSLFISLGCTVPVASLLTKMTTLRGRVPQGAPTSTTLANLVLARHEKRFRALAQQNGLTITFFVDDVTFSGDIDVARFKNLIMSIFNDIGFQVKPEKLEFHSRSERQMVTGLVVNKKPNLIKKDIKKLRARVHQFGLGRIPKSEASSIEGKLHYLNRVNPRLGGPLLAKFKLAEKSIAK